MIETLQLEGALVIIDAMGCQTKIAEAILEKKAGAKKLSLSGRRKQAGWDNDYMGHLLQGRQPQGGGQRVSSNAAGF